MGYQISNPISASVQKVVTESYDCTDLDITDFTFNPRSNVIAFTLRMNRAEGVREEKSFQVPSDEVESLIGQNLEAFRAVRAACFNWLQAKGEIPEGTDSWPGA